MVPWLALLVLATAAGMAHGHGTGSETLPAVMVGDSLAAIQVDSQRTETGVRVDMAMVRLEGQNGVGDVTYDITAKHGRTFLFAETFRQGGGRISFEFESGEPAPLAETRRGGFFGILEEQRFRMSGPGLGGGGLYSFDIRVPSAGGRDLDPPPSFASAVSIPIQYNVTVRDETWGPQTITFWTYYDGLRDVRYDPDTKTAHYTMPFEWDPDVLNEIEAVHTELFIPPTFGDLLRSEFEATVNGAALPNDRIVLDDYFENHRTVHVVILPRNLLDMRDAMAGSDTMEFAVRPVHQSPYSAVTANAQYRILAQPQHGADRTLAVHFNITDVYLRSMTVEEPYRIEVEHGGTVIHAQSGTSRSDGTNVARFSIPDGAPGTASVNFYDIGGNGMGRASIPVALDAPEPAVPDWVRATAKWWADGEIPDGAFIDAVAYMAGRGVIPVEPAAERRDSGGGIDDWVRTAIGWWADGRVGDAEFLRGIAYLVERGVIPLAAGR